MKNKLIFKDFVSNRIPDHIYIGKKIKYFCKKNKTKQNILVYSFFGNKHKNKEYNNYTKILVCPENLYYERYITINSIINGLSIFLSKKIINKIQNILKEHILNIKLLKKKINKKTLKEIRNEGNYAILSNKATTKREINFPYFLMAYNNDFLKESIKNENNRKMITKENIKQKKFCAFIVSNRNSRDRIMFFKRLSKYKKVDSYGSVYKNIDSPKKENQFLQNIEIYNNYKFVIAFENSYNEGYITEKITNVLFSSALPIYKGGCDIYTYFHKNTFLNYDDFENEEELIKKIIYLDQNDDEYIKYFEKSPINERKIKDKINELNKFYQGICNNEK